MSDPIVTHYDGSGNVLSAPHGNGLFQLNYVSGPTANVYYFKHHAPSQTLTYDTSTGKWTDTNTAAPTGIASSHNGTFVAFTSGVVLDTEKIFISETINGSEVCLGGILNPFWSLAGGGGTSTEGVPYPSGSVGRIGQTIVVTIGKNSPSSSATISYSIQKNGVSQGPGISHTNNTTTDFVQNLPFSTGIWTLAYQEPDDDVILDTFNASEYRKRHCNFW